MTLRATLCLLALVAGIAVPPSAVAGELEGSAWRLLNITGMDDRVDVPDDPSRYTLTFGADSRAAIRADCNRGTGSWSSGDGPQLTFGPIAATRVLCPPTSLSDKYLAQFEWVRSYTMRDGHLFLATMADGSIIEFEPLPPVVATVLGEDVHATEPGEMQSAILTRLFDHYAAERGLEVTDAEIGAYLEHMRRGMAAEGLTAEHELSGEEAAQVDAMRRQMGHALIRRWKVNKSLYEAYGGRVIYQQLGPEPLDAYRQYLRERQAAGDFSIADPAMERHFWAYFTDDSKHDFMAPGSEDLKLAFTCPWRICASSSDSQLK